MSTDNVLFLPALSISEAAVGTNGAAPTDNNVKVVAGWDGVNLHTLLTDATGALKISTSSIPPLGQATMAGSLPVVIASNQSAVPISAVALPLPAGAATSANQTTEIGHLASIDAAINAPLSVSVTSSVLPTGAATQATLASIDSQLASGISVTVGSSALPTGAATASNQTTANTSLASIDSKLTSPLAISAATLPLPSGASTSALQSTANTSLASIDSKLTSPLAITAGSLPLPTGAATEATLATLATAAAQTTGNTSLASIDSKLTSPLTVTTSLAVAANDAGFIDGASLTNAYATVVTLSRIAKTVFVNNTTDQAVLVSTDGGSTDTFYLAAGQTAAIDYAMNGMKVASGTNIQAKYASSATSSGRVSVTAIG